jgi:hypothetical protein
MTGSRLVPTRPNRPADPDRVGALLDRLFAPKRLVDPRIDGAHERVPLDPDIDALQRA